MVRNRKLLSVALIVAIFIAPVTTVIGQETLSKPSLAVLKPKVGENIGSYARKALVDKLDILLEEIEKALVNTRKFEIVTRSKDKLEAIRKEQLFSSSSLSSGEAAKTGLMDAAHYLVQPSVNDFVFYRSAKAIPNIDNKYYRQDSGRIGLYVDVLDSSTGQIKGNFFLKSSFATKKEVVNTRAGSPSNRHFLSMAKGVGAQLADQMIDAVFPIIAIKIDSEKVWMNRGNDGGFKTGDTLNIYQPGEALIDPYTGENLGSAEQYVGKLKVDRVNPKFTTGIIVSENNALPVVRKGYILRKPR